MKKKLPNSDITKESLLLNPLLQDIKDLIMEARTTVAVAVNASLTMLYWRIGNRIQQEILKDKRAEYGKKIFATLSQELNAEFGRGFSYSALDVETIQPLGLIAKQIAVYALFFCQCVGQHDETSFKVHQTCPFLECLC